MQVNYWFWTTLHCLLLCTYSIFLIVSECYKLLIDSWGRYKHWREMSQIIAAQEKLAIDRKKLQLFFMTTYYSATMWGMLHLTFLVITVQWGPHSLYLILLLRDCLDFVICFKLSFTPLVPAGVDGSLQRVSGSEDSTALKTLSFFQNWNCCWYHLLSVDGTP